MFFAYRGYTVLLLAPIMAALAVILSGDMAQMLPIYTETFMRALGNYMLAFFPIFLLGALFGQLMADSGAATAIAKWIERSLGSRHAILTVVLACGILTYGGVSLFVVAFAIYPIAKSLFRDADIPKRLVAPAIALGSFTFTMTALPGTPSIQNAIPIKYFGTNTFSAPGLGLIGGAIMFTLGILWLRSRKKAARAAGEGYGEHDDNDAGLRAMVGEADMSGDPSRTMPLMRALLPLVLVIGINALFTYGIFPGMDWAFLKERFPTMDATRQTGMWALIIALVVSIIVLLLGQPAAKHQQGRAGFDAADFQHRVGSGLRRRHRQPGRLCHHPRRGAERVEQPADQRGGGHERAGRHHRLVVGRFVDCAADAGRRLLAHGQRGGHQPRFAAPRGGDVGRRVRFAAALRRHHHAAVDLQADAQAVVPEHRGDDHRDSAHRAERGDRAGHDVWVVLNRFERKSRKDGAKDRKKILRSFLRLLRNLCALCVQGEEAVHCR